MAVGGRKKIKLRFVVWQFVRIMVFLEESKKLPGASRGGILLSRRNEIWRALDSKLAGLGKKNADAFSDLMMEQDVILEDVSFLELSELICVVNEVSKRLTKDATKSFRDETVAAGIIYESEEMKTLGRNLQNKLTKIQHK